MDGHGYWIEMDGVVACGNGNWGSGYLTEECSPIVGRCVVKGRRIGGEIGKGGHLGVGNMATETLRFISVI